MAKNKKNPLTLAGFFINYYIYLACIKAFVAFNIWQL